MISFCHDDPTNQGTIYGVLREWKPHLAGRYQIMFAFSGEVFYIQSLNS